MDIQTSIELEHQASYAYSADQAAAQCIAALGGDQDDTCTVTITHRPETNQQWGIIFRSAIRLQSADRLLYDADQCATQLLAALAGNPTTDTCQVTVVMDMTTGHAGLPYPPAAG
jgi:hypothetical protein